ncbi:MFS transporter [Actinomadura keratinilytica]
MPKLLAPAARSHSTTTALWPGVGEPAPSAPAPRGVPPCPRPARVKAAAREVHVRGRPARPLPWRSSRDFRLLWGQGLITFFGSTMALVALPLQIKELTGSPLAVGAMGAVELVPLVVFGLYGGALADAVDRARVIVSTEAGLGLLALILLVNSMLPEPMLWPLYVVAAGVAALAGLQRPALDSLLARIVPHEQLAAAAALNALRWQAGAIASPAAAGLVVAYAGNVPAYATTVACFAVSVLMCLRLSPAPPSENAAKPSLRGIAEGRATPGRGRCCWGRTRSIWRRCSSPSRTRSSPSSPTSWTPTGRWA